MAQRSSNHSFSDVRGLRGDRLGGLGYAGFWWLLVVKVPPPPTPTLSVLSGKRSLKWELIELCLKLRVYEIRAEVSPPGDQIMTDSKYIAY